MARYLVIHTIDPKSATSVNQMTITKATIDSFTTDAYCITTWAAVGAGKMVCLWEAPSEQAIIDACAKMENVPIDGIYPASVIDWAEMKKMLA
ncbi:MAG TPA: nickel-binding protein [Dehalococcoidia bacterium]|nr:nickel-binding protein [Dehalococcoidia bacterium]